MKLKNLTILLILLSIAMLLVSGCDDRDVPTSSGAEYRITRLESSVDKIYADNNVTFSYISAYVKDKNNFGAAEVPVKFQADRGSIVSIVTTNQSGIARTPFYDSGEVGLATITAFVYTYSEYIEGDITGENSMSIEVDIQAKPLINSLNLEISTTEFLVNQTVVVRARAFDVNDSPVADSTMIRFETDRGYFVDSDGETNLGSIAIIPTQNGNAPVNLNVGQQAGVGSVTAVIDTLRATSTYSVKPSNPFNLQLTSYLVDDDMNPVDVDENGDPVETNETTIDTPYNIVIEANLKDAYNNPNPNRVVRFETSLGSFFNTSESYIQNTNSSGVSRVVFTPGLSAGSATIKAYANSDTLMTEWLFVVRSEQLHAIRFNNESQINLNVINTGGIDSQILYVNLFDINGNLVDRATDIYFKIKNTAPGNDVTAYLSGQNSSGIVHTTSSGGTAAVSVVTGDKPGVIKLIVSNNEAALTDDTIPAIRAIKTNILINSGPPAYIFWGTALHDQAVSIGGGMWEQLMSVAVKDIYGNPVAYGTSVWFSLDSSDFSMLQNAMIQGNGYVGNGPEVTANDAGTTEVDSLSSVGIAYTLLTYSSTLSLSQIVLSAETAGTNPNPNAPDPSIVSMDYNVTLPWNEPETDMQVSPGHIDFFGATPEHLWVNVVVRARDGQGLPIAGVEWTFTSDRGTFYTWPSYPEPFTPSEIFIGNTATSNEEGYAGIKLKIYNYEGLPSPDGVSPGQQQVQIEARVLGTGISENGNVMILKYP